MKASRMWKWMILPVLLISILACATDRTLTQPAPTTAPSQPAPVSVARSLTYTEEGEYTRIRLEGSEPIAPPFYHVLPNPLRIVIDLPNTNLASIKGPVKIDNGTVGEVWATQYDDKGRIEIHLAQMANYNISREGPVLNIDIENAKKEAEAEKGAAVKEKEAEVEKEKGAEAPPVEVKKETEVPPVEVKKEAPAQPVTAAPAAVPSSAEETKAEKKAKEVTDIALEKKDDSVTFNIVADGKPGNYTAFKLDSPPRLVVDLLEMGTRLGKKSLKVENPYVKDVRIGKYPDKLRLVFDSAKPQLPPYQVNRLEDRIVVSFGNVPQSTAPQIAIQEKAPAAAPLTPPPPPSGPGSLTGIDFKQLDDRSRIIISVSGESQIESSLVSKKTLAFDLKNVVIPKRLLRNLDTSEFRSAVQSIQLQNIKRGKSSDARILVKLREEAPYTTTREGNSFLVDVENPKTEEAKAASALTAPTAPTPPAAAPATAQPAPPVPAKEEAASKEATKEEPIKEEAKKEEAKEKEEKAAVESKPAVKEPSPAIEKKPLLVAVQKKGEEKRAAEEVPSSEKVYSGRKISLDFKDADIKNILRLIAEVSDLNIIAGEEVSGKITMRLVDVPWDQALDVILTARNLGMTRVGNVIRVAPQEALKRELQAELEAKRAKERLEDLSTELIPVNYATAKEIMPQIKSVLSDRGDIRVDDRTNTLIIKDIPRSIPGVRSLVRQLDSKTPQVMIEARIIEANLTFQRELGISWGFDKKLAKDKAEIKGGLLGNKLVDFPAIPATGTAGVFQFLINSAAGLTELDMAISAHELDGDVRIISSPKIATLDNKEASIEQGLRIPYLKITTEGTVTTDFIEANLKLTVTPHVTNDGHVKMNIKAKKDQPNRDIVVQGVPSIDKKEAITEVLIVDNGVVVIGGIFTIDKEGTTEGLPLLRKIPLLGWLFKSETKSDIRKDLLIFISPKIIKDEV